MNLFKPEVFQGSFKKKNYFEGWYFKNVSRKGDNVYAFIPGISLSEEDPHAFIQVLNGITGDSHYVVYPIEQFTYGTSNLYVKIGSSVFTETYIDLDIEDGDFSVKGRLEYADTSRYPKSLLAPGIMGWYSYIPFMECYHGIVSANHSISGSLEIGSDLVEFSGGKGYIEKDWGTSFPECWIWMHANSFKHDDASLFVSIAKIPWLGKFFMGFIAFLYLDGKYHIFATYNHSKVVKVKQEGDLLSLEFKNKKQRLVVECTSRKSGILKAPSKGVMSRRIKESIDSDVAVKLYDRSGGVLFEDQSSRTGLEIIEEIFNYL